MTKKSQLCDNTDDARYEYRVWGEHRKARKLMGKLASDETRDRVQDCYLLVDDPSWNAKVRDNTLKIKQLVAEDKGFEQWVSGRHRSSDSAPSPFDTLFDELRLDRPQKGKPYDLSRAVEQLNPDLGVKAVFVTKKRRRFRIGSLRAEVTDIEIDGTGELLRTLSIEGDDLDELVSLRKKLGLREQPNVAVHQAIDNEAV
jgi:hypothetical protein